MSSLVVVVFAKATGHVLACLTRAAGPEKRVPPPEAGSPPLFVRHLDPDATTGSPDGLGFEVGPESLGIAVLETEAAVLSRPRRFAVEKPAEPSALVELPTPGTPGTPRVASVTLGRARLDLTLAFSGTTTPAEKTPVWFQIEHDTLPTPQARAGEIAAGALSGSIGLEPALQPASGYRVLVLAGRCPPHAEQLPVT